MTGYADLEIGIDRERGGTYAVSVRYRSPDSDADATDIWENQSDVVLDVAGFRGRAIDVAVGIEEQIAAYSRDLGKDFYGIEPIRRLFNQTLAANQRLRMRLLIGPKADELHDILWETLPDPTAPDAVTGAMLAASERILFSRYLSTPNWDRVERHRQGELRALVVIANPSDLGSWSYNWPDAPPLAAIEVEDELARVTDALKASGIPVESLPSGGTATLENIKTKLREGCDLLYVVCHGQLIEDQPKLWLEHPDGTADVVLGGALAKELWALDRKPQLVVLASCQSAGAGGRSADRGALAALGPILSEAGVPAVVAMQGDVTMETVASFMPVFFATLRETGLVDQAVAAARAAVAKRPDAWMPVLFMRLRDGLIWYRPGFVVQRDQDPDFDWSKLVNNIANEKCTVILGSGLLENLIGSTQDIAREWARRNGFPLAQYDQDHLPQVAQYVATKKDDDFMRSKLAEYLRERMRDRLGDLLPEAMRTREARLVELMDAAGSRLRENDPLEPHAVLARLPFPIYVTTNPDNLLATALQLAGRTPRVEVFPWWEEPEPADRDDRWDGMDDRAGLGRGGPGGSADRPWRDQPLVYHLFGHFDAPESLVLTEDNYFDYLIGATANKDLIPGVVRSALASRALLFLGFQMTDWDFRVLFRSIAWQQGGRRRNQFDHVAVQIYPSADRFQDTERARHYLKRYFQAAGIGRVPSIYWGNTADFVRDLKDNWFREFADYPAYPSQPPVAVAQWPSAVAAAGR